MQITYDGTFDLATANTSKAVSWRNKEITWQDFLDKISVTHITHETVAEYRAMKPQQQAEIKNVGGFVGGYLTKGRRKKGSVMHRQLITLDLDFAKPDLWDTVSMIYGFAMALYSTHKHTPENPRLRLIIPLDREVPTDEYQAIARKIAGEIGIELFDTTTFEPERLMYWPSTSKDGTYEFHYQDGPWLSADEILNSYVDWKDSSAWPVSEKVNGIIQRGMAKQGDPLEKPGIIGAFCRTYGIADAIAEFLPDKYLPTDVEDRFTYVHGSTAMGLVVYEDKFAFSHHGTDPVSGKLCNAFDLVRIHLHGLKDDGVSEGTAHNKLPSYLAMCDTASQDKSVRIQLTTDRLAEAEEDFGGPINLSEGLQVDEDGMLEDNDEPEVEEDNEWMAKLDTDRKGNVACTIDNCVIIFQNDPRFKGRLAFNDFNKTEVALASLPWRKVDPQNPTPLDNVDASGIRHYLERVYSITAEKKIKDALMLVLRKNKFNPVKDYLEKCTWDGKPRLDSLFIDYLGAEDNEYVRSVTRKAFVAAVARIYRPGVKFDCVLTLVGKQGIGKSQILKKMGGEWFSDSFGGIGTNQAYEQIQGVWLVEIAELAGLKKAEVDMIKHFISKTEDRYRSAYAEKPETCVRMCVFFATTNDATGFLKDATGNRRWWPVSTGKQKTKKDIFIDLTASEVMQIWGEAKTKFQAGEKLYLTGEVKGISEAIQQENTEVDERAAIIAQFIETPIPSNWAAMDTFLRRNYIEDYRKEGASAEMEAADQRKDVCAAEIWCECFNGAYRDMTTYNTKYIHTAMLNMPGWEKSTVRTNFGVYGYQKGYRRIVKP